MPITAEYLRPLRNPLPLTKQIGTGTSLIDPQEFYNRLSDRKTTLAGLVALGELTLPEAREIARAIQQQIAL